MYYCGIDLGAKQSQLCIIDETDTVQFEGKVPNDLDNIIRRFKRYGKDLRIVLESTFNWDWIVYGLQALDYDITMAHTLALRAITSAKVKTDKRDAFTLARLLRTGMIPESYIYPVEQRPIRDMLRKRWQIVRRRAEQLARHAIHALSPRLSQSHSQ